MDRALSHPVPEKLLAHIGDITVSFALLQSTVQLLIGSLIAEHQRVGQIITAELAFRNLRALAISLYKERHGEDPHFAVLRNLMRRAAQLEEARNQITHSVWGAGNTRDTITRVKSTAKEKHGFKSHFENIGESNLAEVANGLKLLAGEVLALWTSLIDAGKAVNNPFEKTWGSTNHAV